MPGSVAAIATGAGAVVACAAAVALPAAGAAGAAALGIVLVPWSDCHTTGRRQDGHRNACSHGHGGNFRRIFCAVADALRALAIAVRVARPGGAGGCRRGTGRGAWAPEPQGSPWLTAVRSDRRRV